MVNTNSSSTLETTPDNLDIDLSIISFDAAETVSAGGVFNVSWTVKNQGADATTTSWYDNIYLSTDESLDIYDRLLLEYDEHYDSALDYDIGNEDYYENSNHWQIAPLQSLESYAVSKDFDLDVLSSYIIPDNYYLLLEVNKENTLLETDRSNNILAIPITVTAANVDFEITDVDVPAEGLLGETINISWEVTNQGTESQHAPFKDRIYLSDDEYLDELDIHLEEKYHSLSTYVEYGADYGYDVDTPLQPGNSISAYKNINLTTGVNGEELTAGDRYLIIVSDPDNEVAETDETNNILSVPITLIAPEDNDVDLEIVSFTVPDPIEINFGEDTSIGSYHDPINVSWTVNNLGADPTLTSWKDKIYYSQDEILDDGDISLQDIYICQALDCVYHSPDNYNTYHQSASVEGGSSYTGGFEHLFLGDLHHIPEVTLGDAYFILVADEENQLTESNETNNTFAVPITLTRRNNNTPELTNAIADLNTNSGIDFELVIPQNTFQDIDEREELSYSATLADSSELPDWLNFDAGTQTFSGTPDDAGMLEITITATDLSGAAISDTFILNVESSPEYSADATVHRFYNSREGVHFYTADENEKNHVLNSLDTYSYEGESYASVEQSTGEEVYRFFNSQTGVHLYTTSEIERDSIIETLDNFSYEGIKFYAYETQVDGSIPIYRFYEPTIGVHFYTPNEAEKNSVENSLPNYNYEGIAYYAFPI